MKSEKLPSSFSSGTIKSANCRPTVEFSTFETMKALNPVILTQELITKINAVVKIFNTKLLQSEQRLAISLVLPHLAETTLAESTHHGSIVLEMTIAGIR
uniref:Uncharacterized protein n=1 Tax=Romanomermis culicivorax TaxID=13658 RepID=A0A915KT14_ROMCU